MADLKTVAEALKDKRTGTYRNELTRREEYIAVVDGKATVIGWCNLEVPKEQRAEWERKVWMKYLMGSKPCREQASTSEPVPVSTR
jgi:hypothetical protein